ncbi:MAG TPA: DUF4433 domain-containing protein [Terriglobales bacterium]|jgi:hypothetical protein|nr:DUF4433 domain-containing protein [Terriglobales bacterium]
MSALTQEKALIFRITHIENVEWLLANGLHCRNSGIRDPNYREIGNSDLIAKRADREISIPPRGTLSDYIPFYFTPYSPMMLNIKTGYNGMKKTPMRDIVILVSSLHKIAKMGIEFIFSDRHAYLTMAKFSNDLDDLDRIDWKILQARDFKRDPNDFGKVERYQAEALIYQHMPVNALFGMVCYAEAQREHVNALVERQGVTVEVKAMPGWYV